MSYFILYIINWCGNKIRNIQYIEWINFYTLINLLCQTGFTKLFLCLKIKTKWHLLYGGHIFLWGTCIDFDITCSEFNLLRRIYLSDFLYCFPVIVTTLISVLPHINYVSWHFHQFSIEYESCVTKKQKIWC